MKRIKKELVYIETEDFPYKTGYSLGTMYTIENNKYKLYNFGFCPGIDSYYYNLAVHIPKKLRKVISSFEVNETNSSLLEDLYGFINKANFDEMTKKEADKVFIKKR